MPAESGQSLGFDLWAVSQFEFHRNIGGINQNEAGSSGIADETALS
jgi:hypothetical protein